MDTLHNSTEQVTPHHVVKILIEQTPTYNLISDRVESSDNVFRNLCSYDHSLRSLAVLGGLGEGLGGAGGGKCGREEIRPAQKLCVFELCVRQRTQNSDWLKY